MTLDWAASVNDDKPSPRLEFVKKFMSVLTQDELGRLKKMVMNKRRGVAKSEKAKKLRPNVASGAAPSSLDAVNSPEVATPLTNMPWWERYKETDIIAFDTEHVTKPNNSTGPFKQHVATLDVVDIRNQPIYSTKVHHQSGTFKDDFIWKTLTGMNRNSFSNPTFPSEETVRRKMEDLMQNKLVVTVGGQSDYDALGLEIADFDYFDLQSHWYYEKVNEHGSLVRHSHSLRSLSNYYLHRDPQTGIHTSLNDAIATMDLFEVYKKIKLLDDPQNLSQRHNFNRPYNEIPVLPNPIKEIVKAKKKKPRSQFN
ncbi:unnamed protein product [Orchesella dallaii]|uniref:Exonuclease domain-containing protein n=1 Tax=Orchesella dallaii TaxID=48710 RepID=A0ABP1QWE2_9HEXA